MLAVAAACLAVPIFFPNTLLAVYIAFVLFECCVGIFWPAMGVLRSRYLQEKARSTIMNLFRVLLNAIVIIILLLDIAPIYIFSCCASFLLLSLVAQLCLCW